MSFGSDRGTHKEHGQRNWSDQTLRISIPLVVLNRAYGLRGQAEDARGTNDHPKPFARKREEMSTSEETRDTQHQTANRYTSTYAPQDPEHCLAWIVRLFNVQLSGDGKVHTDDGCAGDQMNEPEPRLRW